MDFGQSGNMVSCADIPTEISTKNMVDFLRVFIRLINQSLHSHLKLATRSLEAADRL